MKKSGGLTCYTLPRVTRQSLVCCRLSSTFDAIANDGGRNNKRFSRPLRVEIQTFLVCHACWSPAGRYPPVKWDILVYMLKDNSPKIVCRLMTRHVFVHFTQPRLTGAGLWADLVPNCIAFGRLFYYVTFANEISKRIRLTRVEKRPSKTLKN